MAHSQASATQARQTHIRHDERSSGLTPTHLLLELIHARAALAQILDNAGSGRVGRSHQRVVQLLADTQHAALEHGDGRLDLARELLDVLVLGRLRALQTGRQSAD